MKKELKILLVVSGIFIFAGGLFGPLYAVFVEGIGGDLITAGGAYSAFAISAGVLVFIISKWEDHVKHTEKLIIAGYAISAIGYFYYIFVRDPLNLFIVQVIFGIGQAVCSPAYDGLYSRSMDKGRYVFQWGIWESMSRIVMGVSALLGGFIALYYGFSTLFVIMFVLSLLGVLVSLLLIKNGSIKSKKRSSRK